ncbi:MAG: LysR family transcriptional regulator [Rhodospirillales bacterium]
MNRDVGGLDPKLLQAFEALAERRSVTLAARQMGVTQQGLSGMLQRLRLLFNDPLFVRQARGVAPTPRAEALAPRVKQALAGLAAVLDEPTFDPAEAEGTLLVASTDYALSVLVSGVFQRFRALAPGLRLAILPIDTATLGADLKSGRIDLALTILDFAPPNLFSLEVFQERYVGALRAGHPLAGASGAPGMDLEAFCAAEHLLISPDKGDFTGPTDLALAQLGRRRRVGLVCPSFSVAGSVLEQTDLIAVLPERLLLQMRRDLKTFELPLKVPGFELLALWAERVHHDPLHIWFRQLCCEALPAA